MSKLQIWLYIIGATIVALAANSISTIWAGKDHKLSLWFLALLIISPLVFITFGLVTTKLGLALSAGTVDSLLTISTMIVGLILFHEWHMVSVYQYLGMAFAVLGIFLMQIHK